MLSLYLREQQKDRPVRLKKKEIWKGICAELWQRGLVCSWQECDKKYRNLKQTFVRNLKQAGKKECRWMFFPIMLEINKHEPFVNEMVSTALFPTVSSSNNSDYENDEDDDEQQPATIQDEDASLDEKLYTMGKTSPSLHVKQEKSATTGDAQLNLKWQQKFQPRSANMYQPYQSCPSATVRRSSKSPSSSPQPPPSQHHHHHHHNHHMQPQQHAVPAIPILPTKPFFNPAIDMRYIDAMQTISHHQMRAPSLRTQEICTTDSTTSSEERSPVDDEPPGWFKTFLLEFKKHEDKKLQKINDLCAEVRRTNDIEHQRNVILNEKNDILKNMIDFISNK